MAPPNPYWVQRYLRDHNLDALLGDAVNQAVEQRSTDPAASLAQYFTLLSKRNGEVTNISARMCFNSDLTPVVELSVECFFNGGTRNGCLTMLEPITIEKPAGEEEAEGEEEGDAEKRLRLVKMTIDHVNNVVGPALVGLQAKDIVEYDEVLKSVPSAPTIAISLALAETGACMKDEPLYVFVAKAVEHFKSKFETALGGGHHVEVSSAVQLLNDEETPLNEEETAEPSGGIEAEQGEKPFEPQGLPVKMPVVMVPAIMCGPSVKEDSPVRMHAFWLMSKRDEDLTISIPNLIKVYNCLNYHMKERAEAKAQEAQKAREAAGQEGGGEGAGEALEVVNKEGFFLVGDAQNVSEIMGYIEAAVTSASLTLGMDITVCCNMGASKYFVANSLEVGTYCYKPEGVGEEAEAIEADNWTDWVCRFLDENPAIDAIEDVASNEDYETWRKITLAVANRPDAQNNRVTVLGATLYNDDTDLYRAGVAEGWATGAVIRPEALGTLSEVISNALLLAGQGGRVVSEESQASRARIVLAHRTGERQGEAEADVAVGIGAWGIKSGPPSNATIAKLNRLICIQEHLAATHAAAEKVWPDVSAAKRLQPAHCITWRQHYAQESQVNNVE